MKVGLFGSGAYGMALSSILVHNRHEVVMWTKFEDDIIKTERRNDQYLPGYTIEPEVLITSNVEECIKDKDLLIIALPAAYVDSLCKEMQPYIKDNHILIATKGIEQGTGLFMSELVEKYLDTENIAVISGPTFAVDLISKKPAGLSVAGKVPETVLFARQALQNSYIRMRETTDLIGIEICGSIKNVIALSAGMLEGLNANDSTKAMLITEAIHDMENILDAFGCDKRTVLSYAGIGDLLLTCTTEKSRNYSMGKLIGSKSPQDQIDEFLKNNTVEGYYTLESIYQLLKDKDVSIPIIDLIYEIIVKKDDPDLLLAFLVYKL